MAEHRTKATDNLTSDKKFKTELKKYIIKILFNLIVLVIAN